jgi:4-amino-4-deoxy-L-arabinose transferase-like glycosyltransferase
MLRRRSLALPLILALALAARVGVIVATPDFSPVWDARDYDLHALSIAHGHGYPSSPFGRSEPTAFRPPLYPVVLASVYAVGGGQTAGRLLQALLGVAVVALIYMISERLWDRRVAAVAGAIAAVFPPLVLYSATLLTEPLFVLLVLAALLVTLEFRRGERLRWAIAAGVLSGLAALTRGNGILLVVAAGLGVWTMRPRFSRTALTPPLVVALVALVTVMPWVIRNTIVFDRFVGISTQGGTLLAGTYNAESRAMADHPGEPQQAWQLKTFQALYRQGDLDEAQRSSRLTNEALSYMGDHPGYVVETMAWNTLRIFGVVRDHRARVTETGLIHATQTDSLENEWLRNLQAIGIERLVSPIIPGSLYLIMLLALVGIGAQIGSLRSPRAPPFVWSFPLLLVLPAVLFWGLQRYRAPLDPFLVMLAAVGIVALAEQVARRAASVPASGHQGKARERVTS